MAFFSLSPERIEQGQSLAKHLMEALHLYIVILIILTSTLILLHIKKNTFLLIFFKIFFKGSVLIQAPVSKVASPLFIPHSICSKQVQGKSIVVLPNLQVMVLVTHGKLWPENIKWKILEISNSEVLNSQLSEQPDVISRHPAPSCLGGQSPLYSG